MGRPKGSRNRVPATVKDNILAVFTRLGGTASMAAWAKKNKSKFYEIYARMLPKEIEANVKNVTELTIADASTLQQRLAEQLARREKSGSEPTVQ